MVTESHFERLGSLLSHWFCILDLGESVEGLGLLGGVKGDHDRSHLFHQGGRN